MLSNEVLGRGGPDYFLSNPPKQPKKEIGDYVESCGILVPRRFNSLADALSSGKPFIARSEHPQDYAGASDLLYSPKVYPDEIQRSNSQPIEIDWAAYEKGDMLIKWGTQDQVISQAGSLPQDLFEAYLKKFSLRQLDIYCRFMGISQQEFLEGVSYSYWELLPGYNRTVIADNAISGRYHIVTSVVENDGFGYTIVENGNIIVDSSRKLPQVLYSTLQSLTDLYESVRGLERFDRNQCPIMETQTVDDDHYFLQYHRATHSNPSSFTLDREPEDGEITATFVRGATPREGLTLRFNFHTPYYKKLQTREEEAGYNLGHYLFAEVMARKRTLQVIREGSIGHISRHFAEAPHLTVSEVFKSPICIAVKQEDIDLLIREFKGSKEKPVDQFNIRIVSDGRRAYIKRLD